MKDFDLAIIGASFSGLACAQGALESGLRTVVYERKKTPGAYTQSTGILVKEVAERLEIPSYLSRRINGVRLYSPDLQCLDLHSKDYYFLATNTGKLLDWLSRQVTLSGGVVRGGARVKTLLREREKIVLPDQHASCAYLVGADGAKSSVARAFNLGRNRRFLLGAEYEVDGFHKLDPDYLHVFLNSDFAPGYIGWVLRGLPHTQVGLAVSYPRRPRLEHFLLHLTRHFGGGVTVVGKRGGLIPCGGMARPIAKDNVCLLGDAAGMVSPLTAGGIHPAVEIGYKLGEAIAGFLNDNAPPPQRQLAALLPNYTYKKYLRFLYDTVTPPNRLLDGCIGNPLFQRMARIIFFHHRGLFCREAWREIIFGR